MFASMFSTPKALGDEHLQNPSQSSSHAKKTLGFVESRLVESHLISRFLEPLADLAPELAGHATLTFLGLDTSLKRFTKKGTCSFGS